MFRLHVRPHWSLQRPGQTDFDLPVVLRLCAAVHEGGSLAQAARQIGLSYRHAWGLLREAEQVFARPLVELERGRGGRLTRLGEILLWADRRIAARLSPALDSLSSELNAEIERVLTSVAPVRIQASHGFAVQALQETLVESGLHIDLRYTNSVDALQALARQECDLAGFHVPEGHLQAAGLSPYRVALQGAPLQLINLATRVQGLMLPQGNPRGIRHWDDLAASPVRFINRQPGSGTRLLIDLLLREERVLPERISGYEMWEYTHAAVAAYIASGMADVGFGIEAAARRFQLDFLPMASERYFLACRADAGTHPDLTAVFTLLRAGELRRRIGALPGYNSDACGSVITLADAFPDSFPPANADRERAPDPAVL